jgi:hypothetical protein
VKFCYWRRDNHTTSSLSPNYLLSHTAIMPREVTDIKSFIEICRRKDASCTFAPPLPMRCSAGNEGQKIGLLQFEDDMIWTRHDTT